MTWIFAYLLAGIIAEFFGWVCVEIFDEEGTSYPAAGLLMGVVLWLPLVLVSLLGSRGED